jgi:hypothetical protein
MSHKSNDALASPTAFDIMLSPSADGFGLRRSRGLT